jgi:hypothetical protein
MDAIDRLLGAEAGEECSAADRFDAWMGRADEDPADAPPAFTPLPPGASRETRIRRDAQGRWFDDGAPIEHERLCRAFDRWLDRAPDGRYCLHNAIHWVYVEVDGPPAFVRSATLEGDRVRLSLAGGREELLDPDTLRIGPDGALYCDVRAGRLAARFDNAATMALAPLLGEDAEGLFLTLGGRVVRPPRVTDPLAWPERRR